MTVSQSLPSRKSNIFPFSGNRVSSFLRLRSYNLNKKRSSLTTRKNAAKAHTVKNNQAWNSNTCGQISNFLHATITKSESAAEVMPLKIASQ